ncbi:hypothetical protein AAF712_009768 [Marasmius tenuissimus]|uniref:Uncharacterized protein n=1 Tax=Marasmius tenuissimus TaxID=585030 RepID=A0ABR2ZPT4_9AGAR
MAKTPEPGINITTYLRSSKIKGATFSNEAKQNKNGTKINSSTLNWLRTMIQYNLKVSDVSQWPDISQEFSVVSLGSIDPST